MKIPATDSSIRDLVVNVSGIILDEKQSAKKVAIIDSSLEAEGKGKLDKSNCKERKAFAEHVLSKTKNVSKCVNGKKRQQRHSPKPVRVTMALWLRDSKAREEFQQADCHALPTVEHPKDVKSTF